MCLQQTSAAKQKSRLSDFEWWCVLGACDATTRLKDSLAKVLTFGLGAPAFFASFSAFF